MVLLWKVLELAIMLQMCLLRLFCKFFKQAIDTTKFYVVILSFFLKILIYANVKTEPIFLFVHGLGGNKSQVKRYINSNIISDNYIAFNFKDVSKSHFCKFNKVNLAQELDIDQLNVYYQKIIKKNAQNQIILIGVSRGGATVLNFLAHKNPSNIKAAIIECPFDAVYNIVEYQLKKFAINWIPGLKDSLHKAVKKWFFPNYALDGIQPILSIPLINKNIPILIVHSQSDQFIGINSSRAIYCELCNQGHNDVYLVELLQGKHARCLINDEGTHYRNAVHAFYKKYDLSHISIYSSSGEAILRKARPTVEEVKQRILLS